MGTARSVHLILAGSKNLLAGIGQAHLSVPMKMLSHERRSLSLHSVPATREVIPSLVDGSLVLNGEPRNPPQWRL